MRTKRWGHGCFSIEEKGTVTKVVVMGGKENGGHLQGGNILASSEILDVTSMQWKNLPDLPFVVIGNRGVESVHGPFLGFTVGGIPGQDDDDFRQTYRKTVHGLRKNENGDYYWEEVNGLTTGRYLSTVVNAPMSMVPC